jgi:hypothetical protein
MGWFSTHRDPISQCILEVLLKLEQGQNTIMDKLDQALANETPELTALGNVNTNYQALVAEIATLKAAATPPEDPRLQQLLDAQAKVQAAEAALSAAVAPTA